MSANKRIVYIIDKGNLNEIRNKKTKGVICDKTPWINYSNFKVIWQEV